MDPDILFNPRSRSVRWSGIAGARIRPGTISSRDRSGMGDCALMDLRKGFFAVSDSSNRFPTASRRFLRKLAGRFDALPSPDPGKVFSLEEFDRFYRSTIDSAQEVLQTIPFTESCTFTGVLVTRTEDGLKGILFHTGDSRLYEVNRKTRVSTNRTTTNFWMVGKSKRFYQIEEIDVAPDAIFILATDGVIDLSSEDRVERHESLADFTGRYPIEQIPDRLVQEIDVQEATTDDLVIVALDPARLRSCEATILLGGTDEREESRYRKKCNQDFYEDGYVPILEQDAKRECALAIT